MLFVVCDVHAQSIDKAQNTMADIQPLHTKFSYCRNWYDHYVYVLLCVHMYVHMSIYVLRHYIIAQYSSSTTS